MPATVGLATLGLAAVALTGVPTSARAGDPDAAVPATSSPSAAGPSSSLTTWVELFSDGGITVWERPVPGRDLPEYRATGALDENLYEVMAVLNDFPRHHEWMRFMRETRILWRPDDFHLIVYILFDSPWPVWDRDTVMEVNVTLDRDRQEVVLDFQRTELEQEPPIPGVIRVPRGTMMARLRYLGPHRTEVEARMDIDPAGDLPRWLVRWFSRRVPLQALQRLRHQIEVTRGQYSDFLRKFDPKAAAAP